MKLKYLLIIIGFIAFTSCQDDLDYNEFVNYDEEEIFSTFSRTSEFVTNIYSFLDYDLGNYNGAMLSSACDESDYVWKSSDIHDFYNGAWSSSNAKGGLWSKNYEAIRAANFYLKSSDGRTFDEYKYNKDYNSQMERFTRFQYEVRFLRAYYYFNLVRQYGDVPLITTVLTPNEANSVKRTSYNEVFDFIIKECDDIVLELPISYDNLWNKETGRITRATVLALKARTLLYQASPLFNKNNDVALWKEAALANKAVIDSCIKYGNYLTSYTSLWGTENYKSPEVIYARRIGDLNWLEANNYPIGVEGGKSGNCPTQTLVDAYEMKNTGLFWNQENSGYDPNHPYDNKDPRFYMTIAKNGDTKWPFYNSNPLETFIGGLNGSPLSGATTTGYYLKKYLDKTIDLRPANKNSKRHSWITFRLAEFYLNYAECMVNYLHSPNTTDGDCNLTACEAINQIRKRPGVNMPNFSSDLSNDDFIKKYKNERMVELAFENHRFWDVRRWKDGEKLKSITCMKIEKLSDGSFKYERVIKNRHWEDKMYFFPIPDSERRKNINLEQNFGW